MHLALSAWWRGRDLVVEMNGELDMASAPLLRRRVTAVNAAQPRHVLVVCARLRFCDAAGLGALVGLRQELLQMGSHLVLVAPSHRLRQVLKVTYMESHFAVAADLDTGGIAGGAVEDVDGGASPSGHGDPVHRMAEEDRLNDPPGGHPGTSSEGSREPPQR
ncbi:STAS domain-containing protein [Allosalinactinospora lopnorensis]|uniref:STAS domain-containing protein n=1 Tax=Allosalinactinospora lopnorensis TaxID=1352348 RepID=UPI000697CB68|nr:STAS domain-containing protein [Allosalinactinospora lopnorensis]